MQFQTDSFTFVRNSVETHFTLTDNVNAQRLMILPLAGLFAPDIDNTTVSTRLISCQDNPGEMRLSYESDYTSEFIVTIKNEENYLTLQVSFTLSKNCQLNRLTILPPGTSLNFFDLINFRNRHHTDAVWPELLLGGQGCNTDTYSTDWQFAPHPTMLLFRRESCNLLLGMLELGASYGLYFNASNNLIKQCFLDYGDNPHGLPLESGQTFVSARFCLLPHVGDPFDTVRSYCNLLIDAKIVANPQDKQRHSWHQEPLYCTWIDQCACSKSVINDELQKQDSTTAISVLNEELVYAAVDVIEREKLPFRTIILDDGWAVTRGQWTAHPKRFPKMRQLVDNLHSRGFKVLIWWAWPEIFTDAVVNNPDWLAGKGKYLNRHGLRCWDFSNPATRQEYLFPLFHKLFSPDPDCYDLDGIKTDFIADKIHPGIPLHDPSWSGEENYFVKFYDFFYTVMRKFKPDAMHLGCSGNPHLAEFIDANRTFDVVGVNVQQHINRGKMLSCTTPGCPVSFDFTNYLETLPWHFAAAKESGALIEIGNILYTCQDIFSQWQPASDSYYELLRKSLR